MAMGKKYRKKTGRKTGRKGRARRANLIGDRTNIRRQIKVAGFLTPTQGVSVSNYLYAYLSPRHDPAGVVTAPQLPEFGLWSKMYDRFRINSCSIKIIPRSSVNLVANTIDESQNNGLGVYYVAMDRDGQCPSNVQAIKRYRGCKVFKTTSGCYMKYKVKYASNTWFDTSDPNQSNQQGLVETLGLQGGITIYGENFPEPSGNIFNRVWADYEVVFDVSFNTYNPRNISFAEGNTILLSNADDVPNKEFSGSDFYKNDDTELAG